MGDTYFGSVGLINLEVKGNEYLGYFGGDAGSKIDCNGNSCSGYIGGETAYYTISHKVSKKGEPETVIDGSINFYHFTATRKANSFEIYSTGAGYLKMHKERSGAYEGEAIYSSGAILRTFRARLTTSGSLTDLSDNTLFTFMLAAPLSVPDSASAGLGR